MKHLVEVRCNIDGSKTLYFYDDISQETTKTEYSLK